MNRARERRISRVECLVAGPPAADDEGFGRDGDEQGGADSGEERCRCEREEQRHPSILPNAGAGLVRWVHREGTMFLGVTSNDTWMSGT